MLLDVPVVLVMTGKGFYTASLAYYPFNEFALIAWIGFLAARAMLMLGWWFLGEGLLRHRLAGLLLFSLAAIPVTESALALAMFFLFLAPASVWTGMAFVVLSGLDYRLVRGVPAADEKVGQFTVRQLMLLTLIVAVVSALLRWAQQSERNPAIFAGLIWPLLAWVYPFVMSRGILRPKWYPEGLFAAGLTVYVLALPFFALRPGATYAMLIIASYTLTFAIHLLLLRFLGFRLVQLPNAARSKQWLPADWGAR